MLYFFMTVTYDGRVITPSLGMITGCCKSCGKDAFFNLPSTLRMSSSNTGSSWNNWWLRDSLLWLRVHLSSLNASICANLTSTRPAFLLSSTFTGSVVFFFLLVSESKQQHSMLCAILRTSQIFSKNCPLHLLLFVVLVLFWPLDLPP